MQKTGSGNLQRLGQLDALRGVAAMTVVLHHYALLFGTDSPFQTVHRWIEWLGWTPVLVVFAGHQAVLVFFILSGYVLTAMLTRIQGYAAYLWRRVSRLYLPYAVALAVAVALKSLVYTGPVADLGEWFNFFWGVPTTLDSVVRHASFIGHFDSRQYNYAIWSLVQEMRISIIFPFVVLAVRRVSWKVAFGSAFALSVVGGALYFILNRYGRPFWADDIIILHYLLLFVIGALMFLNQERLGGWVRRLSRIQIIWLGLFGLLSYTYGSVAARFGITNPLADDWPALPGAALLVLAALHSPRLIGWLVRPIPLFLGRISYSLYLIHPVIQLGMMYAFYGRLPFALLILVSLAVTVLAATLMYHLVEVPSIALGRRFFSNQRGVKQLSGPGV